MTIEVTQQQIYNQDLNNFNHSKCFSYYQDKLQQDAFYIKAELFRIGDLLFSASQDIFKQLVMSGSQFGF